MAGGGHSKSQADQTVSRIRTFLCVSNEDLIHDDIKDSDIDFSTGPTENIGRHYHLRQYRPFYGDNGNRMEIGKFWSNQLHACFD